jgi:hypothetical protein
LPEKKKKKITFFSRRTIIQTIGLDVWYRQEIGSSLYDSSHFLPTNIFFFPGFMIVYSTSNSIQLVDWVQTSGFVGLSTFARMIKIWGVLKMTLGMERGRYLELPG